MKKITLLTTVNLDGFIQHDYLLAKELESRGNTVQIKPWETLEDEGEDLFIIRTTWNYTEHLSEFLSKLESIKDRLWNPLPLVKWNSNKKYLVDFFQKNLEVIPLYLAHDKKSITEAIEKLGGDEFIVKPIIGASAKGLIKFDRNTIPEIKNEMIVQKFYPQISLGEISLIYFSGEFSYAVRKTPKLGDIRVQEEHGGIISAYSPSKEDFKLAKAILKEIPGQWLYARIDIVPGVGLIELECIEPSLYFDSHKESAKLFSDAIERISLISSK